MKRYFILIYFLIQSLFFAFATVSFTADKGYYLSLSSDTVSVSSVKRDQQLYLHGPFLNESGSSINTLIGIELKDVESGELYFRRLRNRFLWGDKVSLMYLSFDLNFVIKNGTYEVRPIVMIEENDETVRDNWEYISIPVGFEPPLIKIEGDPLAAYFESKPFVGTLDNETEIANTKLYLNLTANIDLTDADLFAFVYKPEGKSSIGYYRISITLSKGDSKEFDAEYVKSGNYAENLEAGNEYLLSYLLFVDKKQVLFDVRYDDMRFKILENGLMVDGVYNSEVPSINNKKIMQNGRIIIDNYDLFGLKIHR